MGSDFYGEQFTVACLNAGTSSFADLPSPPVLLSCCPGRAGRPWTRPAAGQELPHGTTIVAAAVRQRAW